MAACVPSQMGRALNRVATDLLVQAEASMVILTDIGGNILAQAPALGDARLASMAALAAGAFAATRELAMLTGETGFRSVSHEGEQSSLFVQCVGSDTLVVIVYQKNTTLGLVKLYARRAAQDLLPLLAVDLRGATTPEEEQPFELNDQADAVFALPTTPPPHPLSQRVG